MKANKTVKKNERYAATKSLCGENGKPLFEAVADVGNERLYFAGLRFEDSDPVKNELIFEVTDLELIKKILGM